MKHTQIVFNFYEREENDHPELTSAASVEIERQGQRTAYLETDTALIAAAFGEDIANLSILKAELEQEKARASELEAQNLELIAALEAL